MKKMIAIAMSVVMSGLLLAGCGSSNTAGSASTGGTASTAPQKIVVGLDDNFPPMGFRDEKNEIVGFDVDMAKEASKRLGMTVEFKPIDWSTKEVELNSKKIDVIWNGLTITEERKKNILFSNPYMANKQIVVVAPNSAIKTKADLAGKVVGTQDGSSSVDAINADPATAKTFKELKKYPDFVATLLDLKAGRVDAVVVDEILGRYYLSKKPGEYVVIADNFGVEEFGVGLRKDDTALQGKLQKALDDMKKEGKSAEISKKWFGENIVK
jgi:polar amino acid transport system substrate-binding protein